MNHIEVFNESGKEVSELNTMKSFVDYCVNKLDLKNVMFNVIIVNDNIIHELNRKYRNIDRPTDVITFALEDDKRLSVPGVRVLGDIYISYDKVNSQAKEYGHSSTREICFLAVHGLLHLLGYDHMNQKDEKEMFDKQKELLNAYGIKKES